MAVKILGSMQTPDGAWRVEVVQQNRSLRDGRQHRTTDYRLVHGDNVVEGLSIATVRRLLAEAGVDMGELVEGPIQPAA